MNVLNAYIHGEYIKEVENNFIANINPANNEKINDINKTSRQTFLRAVESGLEGFAVWSQYSAAERSDVLLKAAAILKTRIEEFAHIEVVDTGKPITEALNDDIPGCVSAIEYYAKLAVTLEGNYMTCRNSFAFTRREPIGLVAGIGAWNYPLFIALFKIAPALAAGNAMIFKPSEMTPSTILLMAEIFSEAGLPPGVLNIVLGDGEVGQWLAEHDEIGKISITGSVPTGKKVMAAASQNLKRVTCELGGKSPLIIFPDANIDQAVLGAMNGNFYSQGEVCSNGTRVFVHHSIKQLFLDKFIPKVMVLKIGDPLDPNTEMGALISNNHCEKVLNYIEHGIAQGAKILCGGKRLNQPGNYLEPTVFDDCKDEMKICREEIFGPVVSILTFDTEEEVIKRANATPYGLAAGVFSCDIKRAHRVINQLQAGMCWINSYNTMANQVPFGGFKQSGFGLEGGRQALEEYTRLKSVYVELDELG